MSPKLPTAFVGAAFAAGSIATLGFETLARLRNGVSVDQGAAQVLSRSLDHPVATLYLIAIFLLLGLVGAAVAQWVKLERGIGVFALGLLLLGFLYLNGYENQRSALQGEHWTAAALSVGLLPLWSVPVLTLCAMIGAFSRKGVDSEP